MQRSKWTVLSALMASSVAVSAPAAFVITTATYTIGDPYSAQNDPAGNGYTDRPTAFASFTINDANQTVYSDFTYGTATVASLTSTNYFCPPDPDGAVPGNPYAPANEHAALGGSIVNDGILNVRQNTKVQFDRALTADDLIFVAELELAADTLRDEPAGIGLIDSSGNVISGTAKLLTIGEAGNTSDLLKFDAIQESNATITPYKLVASAFTLADFGATATPVWGVYFSSDRNTDVAVVGLAQVPEPALLGAFALGGALLMRRRGS